jgi:hypothetical protein
MPLTLLDIKEKLKLLDEITILETLNISTEDLLERFIDRIEENADTLEGDLEEDDEQL